MSKTTKYKQCRVTRGTERMMTWLPLKFAVKGMILDFDAEGKGWQVESVADMEMERAEINKDFRPFASTWGN